MTSTVALVTGASGQDGSYLVERLLAEGCEVHGLVRAEDRSSRLPEAVTVHELDLGTAPDTLRDLPSRIGADEVWNLGGISSVAYSWAEPLKTALASGVAATALLEGCLRWQEQRGAAVRFLQASSAEIFGEPLHSPQDERTPIRPVSPYGAAKAFAHHAVGAMRHHGLFATSVILYNHESPRRPTTFVTRKITATVAAIARGEADTLRLGNLEARRDWGWAPDYVDAMYRAMRHDRADDYVIATGVAHSVEEFVAAAFAHAGISDWSRYVEVDPSLVRPVDPAILVGDADHARRVLDWSPTLTFAEVVGAMVAADLERTT